jgi:nitroreductase
MPRRRARCVGAVVVYLTHRDLFYTCGEVGKMNEIDRSLYEMISRRRSVRMIDDVPVDEETMEKIQRFLSDTEQLPGQEARFEVTVATRTSLKSGYHTILAYCKAGDESYANVGYVLQKADLYIQSIGLGSIWLGIGKPEKDKDREDFCILMAFGHTHTPLRNGEADFNRLPLDKISNEDNAVARAVRLAPSAQNSQPWELQFEEGKATIRYVGRGVFKGMLRKKLNKIDMGIALRHMELALQNEGREIRSIGMTSGNGGKEFEIAVQY